MIRSQPSFLTRGSVWHVPRAKADQRNWNLVSEQERYKRGTME